MITTELEGQLAAFAGRKVAEIKEGLALASSLPAQAQRVLRYNHLMHRAMLLMHTMRQGALTQTGRLELDFLIACENRFLDVPAGTDHNAVVSRITLFDGIISKLLTQGYSNTPFTNSTSMDRVALLLINEAKHCPVTGFFSLYFFYLFYEQCGRRYLFNTVKQLGIEPDSEPYFKDNTPDNARMSRESAFNGIAAELLNYTSFNVESAFRVISMTACFTADIFQVSNPAIYPLSSDAHHSVATATHQ